MVFILKWGFATGVTHPSRVSPGGQSRGWSKGPFKPLMPLSLWPEHKRGLQIILMWNQIIFSVENQWEVWRGRSRCLSSAVNTALWFSSPFWWERKQLLVNEPASPPALPLFCAPGPTRSLAGWIWGERKVCPIVLAGSNRKRSVASLQVLPRHLWPPPSLSTAQAKEVWSKRNLKVKALPTELIP